jgi:hypothetical protein
VFAALPAVQLAPFIRKDPSEYFAPMAVSLAVSALFLVFVFVVRARVAWRRILMWALPVLLLACGLLTPNWRRAYGQLLRPGTQAARAAAKELAAILPPEAVVIGERSNQMLLSLPIRTATTFSYNSNPIPVIEAVLKADPKAKLYALADAQHSYSLQHYRAQADRYRLRPVKTFKMPSFAAGDPADVYLCEIHVVARDGQKSGK